MSPDHMSSVQSNEVVCLPQEPQIRWMLIALRGTWVLCVIWCVLLELFVWCSAKVSTATGTTRARSCRGWLTTLRRFHHLGYERGEYAYRAGCVSFRG